MSNETLKVLATASVASLKLYNWLNGAVDVSNINSSVTLRNIAEGASQLTRNELQEAADALLQFIDKAHHGKYAADAADAYATVLRTLSHLEVLRG